MQGMQRIKEDGGLEDLNEHHRCFGRARQKRARVQKHARFREGLCGNHASAFAAQALPESSPKNRLTSDPADLIPSILFILANDLFTRG